MEKIEKKRFLILMATYNGEKYIRKQLDSIFGQKMVDVTILVRDDGSVDQTQSILKEFESKTNRIIYADTAEDTEHGPMHNFYSLIKYAQNNYVDNFDYFAFSDQDDIWHDNKLITLSSSFSKENRPQLAYANYEIIDENDRVILKNADKQIGLNSGNQLILLFNNSFAWGHSIIFNSIFLKNVKLDNDILKSGFPHDVYFAKLAVLMNGLIYVPNILVSYRRHSQNVSGISYKVTFYAFLKRINLWRESKIYANVVNGTLLTISKNKNSKFINVKDALNIQGLLESGGYPVIKYFHKNNIFRKQGTRDLMMKLIYFIGIYKLWLNHKRKMVIK